MHPSNASFASYFDLRAVTSSGHTMAQLSSCALRRARSCTGRWALPNKNASSQAAGGEVATTSSFEDVEAVGASCYSASVCDWSRILGQSGSWLCKGDFEIHALWAVGWKGALRCLLMRIYGVVC